MNAFFEQALAQKDALIADRRELHQIPELGLSLPKTSAFVTKRLESLGIAPQKIGESGVTACIGGKKPGKVFLLRGDMDALGMEEQSGLPFASTNGCAHTCGHDIHTAVLLGAARLLKAREAELCGTVKLMFQPAEETLQGAQALLDAGILRNPTVDAGMALHVFPGDLHAGCISWRAGPALASSDTFRITVTGKGGHGAMPHRAVDPISIAAHIVLAAQQINSREVAPLDPLVLTICMLHSGSAHNIIPQEAVMEGSIRAFSNENRSLAKRRLVEICEGTAKTLGGSCEVVFTAGTAATLNEPALANELSAYVGEIATLCDFPQQMGSEDFALVTQQIPAVFFGLGAGGPEEIYSQGGSHNPKVVFNEDAILYGAAVLANCAFKWLNNHDQ